MIMNQNDQRGDSPHDENADVFKQQTNYTIFHHEERSPNDRRRRADLITRGVKAVSMFGSLCAVIAIVMLGIAKPEGENFITGLLNSSDAGGWNTTLLIWAYAAIMISLLTSVIGLIFNTVRLRRKADRFNKMLILHCGVSAILVVLFLVNYSRYL